MLVDYRPLHQAAKPEAGSSHPFLRSSTREVRAMTRFSGERTRLACSRWRLANDFIMLNTKVFRRGAESPSRTGVHARALALPRPESHLQKLREDEASELPQTFCKNVDVATKVYRGVRRRFYLG
jgi:hypothetical protein